MASNFGLLTRQTLSRPFGDVGIHGRPNLLCPNRLASSFNSGVSESMDRVENLLPESERNKWSSGTIAAVDEEVEAAQADVPEVQTRPGVGPDPLEIRV